MGLSISAPLSQAKEMSACCPEYQKCLGYTEYCLSSELTPTAVVICPTTSKSNTEETILHEILPDRVCRVLRNAFFQDISKSQWPWTLPLRLKIFEKQYEFYNYPLPHTHTSNNQKRNSLRLPETHLFPNWWTLFHQVEMSLLYIHWAIN